MEPKKPNPGESLADLNPELAKQWHPSKNNELTPYDVGPDSTKIVWWKCFKGKGHVWRTTPYHRTISQNYSQKSMKKGHKALNYS